MSAVLGAFRACAEEHLPVNLINDWNLNAEDLAKYKVLILPNAACLDERQVKAIDEFVKNGGGLVASFETSLFDEFGEPRKNFALAAVLGADYRGPAPVAPVKDDIDVNFAKGIGPDYWEKRKSVFDFRQDVNSFLNGGKMATYVGPQTVTFKGPAVRVAPHADAKAAGWIRGREATSPELPAVLARQHGKGKVVYSAAGFDSANYLYSYPYHRVLLKNAIEHAAPAAPPVRVTAPMCVQSTVMRQTKNGQRLVVHLFNDVNTAGGRALPVDDVPLREEVLPIADIHVQFAPGYRIKSVKLQPEGKELAVKDNAVTVPKLEIHTLVVAELE